MAKVKVNDREVDDNWDVLCVVSPPGTPSHLQGVFLTRDEERANDRARQCGGLIFKALDLDAMAARVRPDPK